MSMSLCPKCNSKEIVKGIQQSQANIYPEKDSLFSFHNGSEISHVFCSDCGFILESFVKQPQKFKNKK